MTTMIWKFRFPAWPPAKFTLEMPLASFVLSVQLQDAGPVMWAIVDPTLPLQKREFRTVATGQPLDLPDAKIGRFLGTLQLSMGLVVHVFAADVTIEEALAEIDRTDPRLEVKRWDK